MSLSLPCCATAVDTSLCPEYNALLLLVPCFNASIGELCEGNGECGTSNRENNCASWDVYEKIECKPSVIGDAPSPPSLPPLPPKLLPQPLPQPTSTTATVNLGDAPPPLPLHPPPQLPPPHPPPRPPMSVPALPPPNPAQRSVAELFFAIVSLAFALATVILAGVFKCFRAW